MSKTTSVSHVPIYRTRRSSPRTTYHHHGYSTQIPRFQAPQPTSKYCQPWPTAGTPSAQRHRMAQRVHLTKDYSATVGSEAPLAVVSGNTERRSFPYRSTPTAERTSFHDVPPSPKEEEVPTEDSYAMPRARSRSRSSRLPAQHPRRDTISSVRSSWHDAADRAYWALLRRIRRPARAWLA